MKVAVRSTLINQVPRWVGEENPLFMDFLDAYYEFLEQDGYSIDYIRNALSFLDVDQTIDKFINFFWEEVRDIPMDSRADRRLLAKHIYDLYQSKGTVKSYKLLFRILYNEEIDIYTPKVDMLRISDGKWSIDSVIRATPVSGNPFDLIGLSLRQTDPDATLLVQNVIRKTYGSSDYYDIYINPRSEVGAFRYNEPAFAKWTDENDVEQTITVYLPVAPVTPDIRNSGSYYDAGTIISLFDTSGQEFNARVSDVGLGSIDSIMILDGGSGYSVGNMLVVDNTGTGGTGLVVKVTEVQGGVASKLMVINPGQGYYKLPAITGAHGGTFLPVSKTIGRITDVSIADIGINHPVQNSETTINTKGIITAPNGTFVAGEFLTLLDECLLTENYFAMLNEDGTRILNEEQVTDPTAVLSTNVVEVVDSVIELNGPVSRRAIGIEQDSGHFLNEDGSAILNENSSADLYRRTIVGVTSGATCRILDINPASIVFNAGTTAVTNKSFSNLDGMISESTKRIQDSKFYQDFSYVIKSSQSLDSYKNIVQKLIHPAGLAMFGEVRGETMLTIGLRVIEQFDSTVNIETYLNIGFAPSMGETRLTIQSQMARNSYVSLDTWKFQNVASISDGLGYQGDTMMYSFADLTFDAIYEYQNGVAVGYKPSINFWTRGSEIKILGNPALTGSVMSPSIGAVAVNSGQQMVGSEITGSQGTATPSYQDVFSATITLETGTITQDGIRDHNNLNITDHNNLVIIEG